jgi:predicted amidohydrolase YtcJ
LHELQPLCTDGNSLHHRLEHLEVTPPPVIDRLAATGAWACVQPNFARRWSQPGGMNEQRLGRERLQHCNVYRSLQDASVPLAFGSDCMPLGPLYGLQAAVQHPLAHQRLLPEQALHYYTSTPAAMCFGETGAGLLQPGQRADLAVVRGDPFDAAAAVAATMMDGNWVWQDGSLA